MNQPQNDPGRSTRLFSFIGGETGEWLVTSMATVAGATLAVTPRLKIVSRAATDVGNHKENVVPSPSWLAHSSLPPAS